MPGMTGMIDTGLLEYGVLGPLTVGYGEYRMPLTPGGTGEKIIAILLEHLSTYLSAAAIAEMLGTTEAAVHTQMSRLRGTYQAGGHKLPVSLGSKAGYRLNIRREQVDANRFRDLFASAQTALAASRLDSALLALDEALSLWRGDAVMAGLEFPGLTFSSAEELYRLQFQARIQWCDVNLDLNRPWQALPTAERLVAREPLSQPAVERLVRAEVPTLGREKALGTCQAFRTRLENERCMQPDTSFTWLQQRIADGKDV